MLRAELFPPVGEGPHPGVVVLHESFGLNDDMRRIARRFADAGYAALAPDLYSHGSRMPTPMAVGYDEAAARDGWERMLSFFDQHVRGSPP